VWIMDDYMSLQEALNLSFFYMQGVLPPYI